MTMPKTTNKAIPLAMSRYSFASFALSFAIFSSTVSSLIGQPIEIYNTTGAVGAARAAGIENNSTEDYSESIASIDFTAKVEPDVKNKAYFDSYQKWKDELDKALNNLNKIQ